MRFAYHYGNRRLIFLRHRDIVRVVRALAEHRRWLSHSRAAGWQASVAQLRPRPVRARVREVIRARRRRRWLSSPEGGLDAPICLTWELTYACNLACVHCLSSSGAATPAS